MINPPIKTFWSVPTGRRVEMLSATPGAGTVAKELDPTVRVWTPLTEVGAIPALLAWGVPSRATDPPLDAYARLEGIGKASPGAPLWRTVGGTINSALTVGADVGATFAGAGALIVVVPSDRCMTSWFSCATVL